MLSSLMHEKYDDGMGEGAKSGKWILQGLHSYLLWEVEALPSLGTFLRLLLLLLLDAWWQEDCPWG